MATNEAPIVSHGRGGTGNIGADPTPYADGEIVREGAAGDQGDGAYSAGRGGAGNIGSPGQKPAKAPHDQEVVPENALTPEKSEYHVGRGGRGNEHHKTEAHTHKGLADKLKDKLFKKSN